jgi:uncharacterized protein (TIGR03437 family)
MWLSGNIVNLTTGTPGVSAGSTAVVRLGGAPTNPTVGNLVLHLNDKQIPVLGVADGQVTFQIPSGTAPGAAVLRAEVGGEKSLPILLMVEPPAPKILSVVSSSPETDVAANRSSTVRAGQLLKLTVDNLTLPDSVPDFAWCRGQTGRCRDAGRASIKGS